MDHGQLILGLVANGSSATGDCNAETRSKDSGDGKLGGKWDNPELANQAVLMYLHKIHRELRVRMVIIKMVKKFCLANYEEDDGSGQGGRAIQQLEIRSNCCRQTLFLLIHNFNGRNNSGGSNFGTIYNRVINCI